jgi:hypothetical protein
VASKVTAPIAPKPTVKAVKVAPVAAAKVGEGETPPTPAGAGSVAAPAKVEESVRQPDGGVSPKQKLETPAQPKSQDSTKPAADFELPAAVYSPQLLESVIYDIEHYLEWYRQTQVQKRVGAKPSEEPTHSAETVLVIESWLDGKPATLETLEDLIATLRGLKLAQVHIMLAALPNRSQRETLVNWFRTNVSPHLLLSFVADRNLGGGAVIRTPNRVFDYTWKQQLIAGRGKLAEILKRV